MATQRCAERDAVMAMLAARILQPRYKLATARELLAATLASTLGELLNLSDCDEELLYRAMDWLLPRQRRIEQALAKRHLKDGTLALYDVSSTTSKDAAVRWRDMATAVTANATNCRSPLVC